MPVPQLPRGRWERGTVPVTQFLSSHVAGGRERQWESQGPPSLNGYLVSNDWGRLRAVENEATLLHNAVGNTA